MCYLQGDFHKKRGVYNIRLDGKRVYKGLDVLCPFRRLRRLDKLINFKKQRMRKQALAVNSECVNSECVNSEAY